MSTLNLALAQMNIKLAEPQDNFQTVGQMARLAKAKGADLLVLPEMWNTGYCWERIGELAEPEQGPTWEFLRSLALENQLCIVGGSIPVYDKDGIYNTTFVFDAQGKQLGMYRKIHLFGLMQENIYLKSGETTTVIDMGGWHAGLMLCYDIRFPELARSLTLKGASVIFLPAQFPLPRLNHWLTLIKARAIENQVFMVAVNRTGSDDNCQFFGHSLVVDPWGEVLAEGNNSEELVMATIDLTAVAKVREVIPCLKDRRPDIYF